MERTIIAGIDRSAHSRVAADWAAREAQIRGLPLRLLHVSPRLDGTPAASALLTSSGTAEMIVLGVRGEGGRAAPAVGSTALTVTRNSTCPVVLVPSGLAGTGSAQRPERVTLGVDARSPAQAAIDFAFDTAHRHGVRLHVVHAWTLPSDASEFPFSVPETDRATWEDQEVQRLSDVLRPWHEKYPTVPVLEDVVLFTPAHALIRNSGPDELLVVGRRPGKALGTATHALLQCAEGPIAVVPS